MCERDAERLSKPLRRGDDMTAYNAQARERVVRGGGAVLQVHSECGDRISYGPYRATSRAMIKLLQGCACARFQTSNGFLCCCRCCFIAVPNDCLA